MTEDAQLLRRYAEDRSEAAFAELVRLHLGLVYSSALRQVGGDAHLARDVAQTVFTDLAGKAASLAGRSSLAGWLYTSTRYAAAKTVRTECRRRAREQQAHAMEELARDPTPPPPWDQLRPVLDDAMHALGDRDREAVLLRFFENRDFADIGARIGLSENAARMRVDRALDKLHAALARRGITSTATALATALTSGAVTAAPISLATSITAAALAGASATGGGIAFLTLMNTAKFQLGASALLLAAGSSTFLLQHQANARLNDELAALRADTAPFTTLAAQRATLVAEADEVVRLRTRLAARAIDAPPNAPATPAPAPAATIAAQPPPPADLDGPLLDPRELDSPPRPTKQTPPLYPAELRSFRITGKVLVSFIIDRDGAVRDARIVNSTHSAFEPPALAAVAQWRFEPGRKSGTAVNTRVALPIVFQIRNDGSDWF